MDIAFNGEPFNPHAFQASLEMVGHSANVALRRARGNNQKISDFGFTGEFDDDGIFGLVVLKSCFHLIEEVLNQWRVLDICYV